MDPDYHVVTVGGREPPREAFIRSTYLRLCCAIAAFAILSAMLFEGGIGFRILALISGTRLGWPALLGAFLAASWIAARFAERAESRNEQLIGLMLYVAADGVLFAPLIAWLSVVAPGTLPTALMVAALAIAGLTWAVTTSEADFSFSVGLPKIVAPVALGAIVLGMATGFSARICFSAVMLLLAAAAILYDTATILRRYPSDRPAGAALRLLVSVGLLSWYMLRLLEQRTERK